MDHTETNNVISFPRKSLFGDSLRRKMRDSIKDKTEKPDEVVESLENVICGHLVGVVRQLASELGRRLGERVGKALNAS